MILYPNGVASLLNALFHSTAISFGGQKRRVAQKTRTERPRQHLRPKRQAKVPLVKPLGGGPSRHTLPRLPYVNQKLTKINDAPRGREVTHDLENPNSARAVASRLNALQPYPWQWKLTPPPRSPHSPVLI